jgi:hypothetical protein
LSAAYLNIQVNMYIFLGDTRWRSYRKVAGSIPGGVIGNFR